MNEAEVSVLSLRKGLYKYQMLSGVRPAVGLVSSMCSCHSYQPFSTRKVSSLELVSSPSWFFTRKLLQQRITQYTWTVLTICIVVFQTQVPWNARNFSQNVPNAWKCALTIAMWLALEKILDIERVPDETTDDNKHWTAISAVVCCQRICSSLQQICDILWLPILRQAVFHLIYAGLFWFVLPSSLVICNDIMAYYCGQVGSGRKIMWDDLNTSHWCAAAWRDLIYK